MTLRCVLGAALLACFGGAQAGVVFSDDFDAAPTGLSVVPPGWTVSSGTVDVVSDTFFALCRAGSRCVDLDGSNNDAGMLSRQIGLTAGVDYLLSFSLQGNQRGGLGFGPDDVRVTFGDASLDIVNLAPGAPQALRSLAFTPSATGLYTLSFANAGGDNVGALLDDVSVTSRAVPEPATATIALLGLAGLAGLRRRRARG